ncbi:MAG TPA: hypothetical protein VID74_00155 [Gemmatimonadales bacterium]|jgi:hypothetical protein
MADRIDRVAFDRVLQRAAELQAASKDIGEGLSEDEILALGVEVGIPAQHLRQALLEERTRAIPQPALGTIDRWIAPADFIAQRVVQGTTDSIQPALIRWLEQREHFVVQRATEGRVTFEPMETFAGAMRRIGAMFDPSRGKPYLDKAELVTAVVTPLEAGFCHVTLGASLHKSRSGFVVGGTGLACSGAAMGGVMLLAGAPLLIAALPVLPLAFGGWAVARSFRGRAHRAQLGLERALDELERRPALASGRPGTAGPSGIARGVGRVVRDITQEVRKALDE